MTDPDTSYFDVYYRTIITHDCVVQVQAKTAEEAEQQFLQNWQEYHQNANSEFSESDLLDVVEVTEL